MKKISLEHAIRKIHEEKDTVLDAVRDFKREMGEVLAPGKKKVEDAGQAVVDFPEKSLVGPNAGPLGFGVYPLGIPSIENTRNLSPHTPGQRPAELQKQQMDQMRGQVSTPAQSSSSTATSSQPEVKTSASKADERIEPKKVRSIKVNSDGTVKEGYTSLEHSIRKIHNESVGNLVDPKQSHLVKAAFNKPVQIEPPEGEEHGSMRALNVSNQRKQIKQAESQTRSTFAEDVLSERAPRGAPHVPDEVLDLLPNMLKPPSVKPAPAKPAPAEVPPATPAETPMVPKPVKPTPVKPSEPIEPVPHEIPGYEPTPVKPGKVAPAKPAPAEVPTEPAPSVDPGPGPRVKTETPPKTKADVETQVKTDTPTQTKTDVAPAPLKAPQKAPPVKTTTKTPKTPEIPSIGGSNQTPIAKDAPNTQAPIYIHGAKARKMLDPSISMVAIAKQIMKKSSMKEETDRKDIDLVARDKTERKKVEYVGRDKLNAKKTLGRQAAYKTNVIDEAEEIKPSFAKKIKSIVLDKKEENLGINPVVETQPRLKPLHMAEQSVSDAIYRGSQAIANSAPARITGKVLNKTAIPLTALGAGFEYGERKVKGQTDTQAAGGAAADFAGSTAGMLGGAKLGAAAGALGGPAAPITVPLGAIAGGIAGGIGGSYFAGKAYDKYMGLDKDQSEPSKPEQPKQQKQVPADTSAAVADEEPSKKKPFSIIDPTPVKKQGM